MVYFTIKSRNHDVQIKRKEMNQFILMQKMFNHLNS